MSAILKSLSISWMVLINSVSEGESALFLCFLVEARSGAGEELTEFFPFCGLGLVADREEGESVFRLG